MQLYDLSTEKPFSEFSLLYFLCLNIVFFFFPLVEKGKETIPVWLRWTETVH